VAVVSRHALVRAGIAQLLSHDPDRAVVFDVAARDGHLGGQDIAIYDLAGLVDSSANDLHHLLASGAPVVALEPHARTDLSEGALAAGVAAVVCMDVTTAELLDVLERAVAGVRTPPEERRRQTRAKLKAGFALSDRELDILDLIAQGHGNQQIGAELYLSVNSIKSYVRTGYRKIGARSRSQAVLWAVQHGLGHPAPTGE
jgi:DNA-binding NarL/FixJ family response regulator